MDFKERLRLLVGTKAKSDRDFAMRIGMSSQTFGNYMNDKRKPSFELVVSILSSFDDVSAEWLLRGDGEMLKSENQPIAQVNVGSVVGDNNIAQNSGASAVAESTEMLIKTISAQQKIIEDLQKTINKLVEKL